MSHQLFVVIVTKPVFICVCTYCYTLKDSNKIQNFVNKILIMTEADTVAAGGVNGMILLLVQFSHHLYPKIFLL